MRLVVLVLVAVLLCVAVLVVTTGSVPGEDRVLRALASASRLRGAARLVDAGTGYVAMAVAAGALAAALLRVRRGRAAAFAVVAVWGAIATNTLLKRVVRRDRPDLLPAGVDVSPFSFPSGHAAATAALATAVLLLTARVRPVVGAVAVVPVLAAGAAQLVLARHHPSDVLAGGLWAAAWTTGVWMLLGRPSLTSEATRPSGR